MDTKNFGAVVLSLLLLGASPTVLLAHEGHEHGGDRGGYQDERDGSGRYDPRDEDDQWEEDEGEKNEGSFRSSQRRYPPPDWERPSPRQYHDRPR